MRSIGLRQTLGILFALGIATHTLRAHEALEYLKANGVGLVTASDDDKNDIVLEVDFSLGQVTSVDAKLLELPSTTKKLNLDSMRIESLAQLADLQNLESIAIGDHGNPLSEISLSPLAQLPKLRDVTVRRGPITRQHIFELSAISALRNLQLDYSCLSRAAVESLSELTNIRTLVLENLSDDIDIVSEVIKLRFLKSLSVTNWSCKNAELVATLSRLDACRLQLEFVNPPNLVTAAVAELRTLRGLVVTSGNFSELQMQQIAQAHTLERLAFISSTYNPKQLKHLSSLKRLTEIYVQGGGKFDQGGYEFTNQDFDFLLKFKNIELVVLDFDGSAGEMRSHFREPYARKNREAVHRRPKAIWLSDAPQLAASWLANNPDLVHGMTSLTARNCDIHSDLLSMIAKDAINLRYADTGGNTDINNWGVASIAKLPLLCELDISSARNVTDQAFAEIDMSKFTSLKVAGTSIGDLTVSRCAGSRRLRTIDIGNTKVTDNGCSALASVPNLETLRLADTNIAVGCLSEFKKCYKLRTLCLSGTGISDVSMEWLRQFQSLRELDISWTAVTGDGIRNLASLTSLRDLMIYGTSVEPAACDYLSNAIPRVVIYQ